MFKTLIALCLTLCMIFPVAHVPNDIVKEDASVWIWGDVEKEGLRYRFGYLRDLLTGEMDGFLLIQDSNTAQVLLDYRYDQGYLEEFIYLGVLSDGSLFVISREHRIVYPSLIIKDTVDEILFFSSGLNLTNKLRLDRVNDAYGIISDTLISQSSDEESFYDKRLNALSFDEFMSSIESPISFQGVAFLDHQSVSVIESSEIGNHWVEVDEGNFHFSFQWTIQEETPLFEDYQWTIWCSQTCLLDGEVKNGELTVNEVGRHLVEYAGVGGYSQTYELIVEVQLEGVEDNEIYSEGIQIFSNAESMTLDNQTYESQWIHDVGDHEIVLYGSLGYERHIRFTILSHAAGILDQATIENEVTFFVFGTGYLNQEEVSGEVTIQTPGEYELSFYDENGFVRTLVFTIVKTNEEVTNPESSSDSTSWIPFISWIPLGIGTILLLKKKTKTTSTMI